jgi:hypothetical protein
MLKGIIITFTIIPLLTVGQTGSLDLKKSITLSWVITKFEAKVHKLSYCNEGSQKYLCKIDGKEWYGSDRSPVSPKNQLDRLTLKIGKQTYRLKTDKMFNPNYSGQLYAKQFKIKRFKNYYRLYSFFSDGAGTYTVYWRIAGGKSSRELISTSEEDFSWQFEE